MNLRTLLMRVLLIGALFFGGILSTQPAHFPGVAGGKPGGFNIIIAGGKPGGFNIPGIAGGRPPGGNNT